MLINFTGLFCFLSIASAPAYNRLYAVSVPALILLVWCLGTLRESGRTLAQLLWVAVLAMGIARPLIAQIRWKAYLSLPTGRTVFFEPVLYEKCKWLSERTRPNDYFFGDHMISFALRLQSVGRVPFLRPTDYTRPEEVQDAIQELERFQVGFVSWYSGLNHKANPAGDKGDHLGPIRAYLNTRYHVAQTFSNGDQIWERDR
jgi:hypothetical protein